VVLKTLLAASLLLALAACSTGGGGGGGLNLRADRFLGGALSGFGGADGSNTTARQYARELTSGRTYDFTPAGGFTISTGAVQSIGQTGSGFGIASGSLNVNGDVVTVILNPTSTNPAITDMEMTGVFSFSEAQQSIIDPGASFTVDWDMAMSVSGVPLSLSAQQVLSGQNFM
jgi:hypothetical protein